MDIKTLSDGDLDQLRLSVLAEQERRAKRVELPGQVAALARDAVAAGCDPAEIVGVVQAACDDC